jgi:hypothetical protein
MFSLKSRLAIVLSLVFLAGSAALAQVPSAGSPTGINAAFVKLFGPGAAFTAKADALVIDKSQQTVVQLPMDFAALDSKVRLEINMEQMKSKDLPAGAIASLKEAGKSRVISILRPDKQTSYIIYPGVQSYMSVPLAKGEAEAFEKGLKMEKTALGKETLDGHACVKNKVTIRNDKGAVLEAITWNAADLKDFPLQIEMKEKENTVRMHFSQVSLTKPDARQFEVPPGYGLMK